MTEIKCKNCLDAPYLMPEDISEKGKVVRSPDIILHLVSLSWSCNICGKHDVPNLEQLEERKIKVVLPVLDKLNKWIEERK